MNLYNTLSRSLEQLESLEPGKISLYTCGPTVYDYSHLGNLRAYVFDDTLRRALEAKSYTVKHVMNITDVGHLVSDEDEGEDKLETGAAREHKTVTQVAQHYINAFKADVKSLNILEPNGYSGPHGNYARATDFIAQQLEIIGRLVEQGYGYITIQAIYFDVSKLDDYGKLTGQRLSDKEVGARSEVVTDEAKHNPQDFALWFFKQGRFANHSLSWPSEWGDGFPGWHLECSAIIHATLGEPIDIHTGGVDHIGTHHTNEIAQTEAAFGVELAKYWLHNEHLLVDSKKMSKSLGNFYTLKDVVDKGYSPMGLRLLYLQAHYRSQQNFTWESMEAAESFLKRLNGWAELVFQKPPNISPDVLNRLKSAVFDDLNTPQALAIISKDLIDSAEAVPSPDLLVELDKLFGLSLSNREDINDASKRLIAERERARAAQDWHKSDLLRQQLQEQGLEIDDTATGPVWKRL